MNPRHPIYIISKGRWEARLTVKALDGMNTPYRIVIEPQEYPQYSRVINPAKILQLPFSNLGKGSIPARNWVWEHSRSAGAEWHWILDDNIRGFYRYNRNQLYPVTSGTMFYAAESFVDRYENIGQAGFNYYMFISRKAPIPPFYLNTRVYSCILNRNDHEYKWRGRYNEDTDLSIRILKDYKMNWCTILFNAFICEKMPTMTQKGGNTDELYKDGNDSRLIMTESLIEQHPDLVKKTFKFGHWHHQVDYSSFKNKSLILKKNQKPMDRVDNFGMVLQEHIDGAWRITDDQDFKLSGLTHQ